MKQVLQAGGQSHLQCDEDFSTGVFETSQVRLLSGQDVRQNNINVWSRLRRSRRRWARQGLRSVALFGADALSVGLSAALTCGVHALTAGRPSTEGALLLGPMWGIGALGFALIGEVFTDITNAPRELKRCTLFGVAFLLMVGFVMSTTRFVSTDAWRTVFVCWLFSLGTIPLMRAIVRRSLCRYGWWLEPVVVLGSGRLSHSIIDTLRRRPELGLLPVAMYALDRKRQDQLGGVPVLTHWSRVVAVAESLGVRRAIVTPEMTRKSARSVFLAQEAEFFDELLVIPDDSALSRLLLSSRASTRSNVPFYPAVAQAGAERTLKRAFDVLGALLLGFLALPLMVVVAIITKLSSKGPVFYGHLRIGQGGRYFRVWKFRSMVSNADAVLKEYLSQDPKARREWEHAQKLRRDPRITPLGRLLRKTSLDELPQLWNVLVGEMSLVGPRPIITAERHHYGDHIESYEAVLPGLSGLWQVSGRSDTTYEERVQFDVSYVRNWSIWLDLCILARTVPSMLAGRGAR